MGGLIFVSVALLIAFGIIRSVRQSRRLSYILSFPYAEGLDRKLALKYPHLTSTQRDMVFDGLRDYFHVNLLAKRRMIAMPSQAVDEVWHEFILSTRVYQEFCDKAFGRYLHHTPAEAMKSKTSAQAGIKRAWRIACGIENIDPAKPSRLPRLFAIDGLLLIPAGFTYALNCMATPAAAAGMDGFCATHIGCSSGCSSSSDGGGSDGDGGGCGGD